MKFPKDILLIDFEGFKFPKQIGAVLLDKNTLEEKDFYSSYIYGDMGSEKSLKSGITQEMLNGAPTQAQVGKIIFDKFGTEIMLASFVSDLDLRHFRTLMTSADIDSKQYDYHILDIWPVAYIHLLKNGYAGKINSEEIFQAFGAKPRELHDALEDCRIAADVLRKLLD